LGWGEIIEAYYRALVTISSISHGYYLGRDCYRSFPGNAGNFGEGLVVLATTYQFSQVARKKVNNLFKWGNGD